MIVFVIKTFVKPSERKKSEELYRELLGLEPVNLMINKSMDVVYQNLWQSVEQAPSTT